MLNRIPFRMSYDGFSIPPLYIDWTADDEVLEMIEQLETSQLRFSHTTIQPQLIIDVGASCGLSSHVLLGQSPEATLVAFEPRTDAVRRWRGRMRRFGARAEIHQAAIGITSGSVDLEDRGVGSTTGPAQSTKTSVPLMTIDALLGSESDLVLKLDVEGAERELLPAWAPFLRQNSVLLLETHHDLAEVRRYSEPLRNSGFRWHLLRYRELPQYGGPFAEWLVLGPGITFR